MGAAVFWVRTGARAREALTVVRPNINQGLCIVLLIISNLVMQRGISYVNNMYKFK